MEVFKFGGASVKDANGVKNLFRVLRQLGNKDVVVVISAMGKMTNAFEDIVRAYLKNDLALDDEINNARQYHYNIIEDLKFEDPKPVMKKVQEIFDELIGFTKKDTSTDYDYIYDQMVSRAEFLSTIICSAYLKESGIQNQWLDARICIRTNSDFRRAKVDWNLTGREIHNRVNPTGITITQGFIGSDPDGNTTTLGREGSDYTAAILAYCLDVETVSIFKDVPGVLNADPREFENTTLIEQLSYKEAIEMAFYGASVIHPKTLQPLQRKGIPLKVRSFVDPELHGTFVGSKLTIEPQVACFIVKKKQVLVSIADKEFHFVMEEDISEIFSLLHEFKLKVNLIQNSAISFSVCIEDNFENFENFLDALKPKYKVKYNENLILYTIRHFTEEVVGELEKGKEVLLKQRSRETVQLIVKA